MIQLETVEDFERIKKALRDPDSMPSQFAVKTFGYCNICYKITEYDGDYGMEGCYETCRNCHRTFGSHSGGLIEPSYRYVTLSTSDSLSIPHEIIDELRRLESREQQYVFFEAESEKMIKKYKARERQTRVGIRRLAKLRSVKKV